jgi:predicted TPR repeat methyltransferase
LKKPELAMQYYKMQLGICPEDELATFWLSILRNELPEKAPPVHVQSLFDSYADAFDAHLTGALRYTTPALLMHCLHQSIGGDGFNVLDWQVHTCLDLGCGTGLMGEQLRCHVSSALHGVDLSKKMIDKARGKGLYDHLEVGDMLALMEASCDLHDLIVAADVFVYVGNLRPYFLAARRIARPGAIFAFSTETASAVMGSHNEYHACLSGRFEHSDRYVVRTAEECGWDVVRCSNETLRYNAGQPVHGTLFVMRCSSGVNK